MTTFIALYRGLNVGGSTSVKMDALRALHEQLGHTSVRTKEFGFSAKVMVVEGQRWQQIARANPFAKQAAADPKSVHVVLCQAAPNDAALKALLTKTGGRETFMIRDDVLYLHAPDGFGTSKFAAGLEKAAGVPLTARNWRTVEAILALISGT